MENWKPIKGYEGLYEVSDEGRVRSLDREITYSNGRMHIYKGKIMQLRIKKDGYVTIRLSKEGLDKQKLVHRLVYEAFNGTIPEGMQVNHIDEDKTNNRLDNLNLMTCKENNNFGTRNERISQAKTNGKSSKAVYGYNPITGELVISFPSTREAERNGFNHTNIGRCAIGKYKQHKGLKWSYFR